MSGASAVVSVSEEGGVRAEITVPASGIPAVLTIPCKASSSSVAVLLAADDSRSVLPWAVPVQDGLMLRVEQSCTVVLEDRPADYSDVSSQSWYYDALQFVSSRELFQGTGENRFSPGQTMTRAMLATVLHRLAGSPDGLISREALATMLYRYAQKQGLVLESTRPGSGAFDDVSSVSGWARDAMDWACSSGIFEGSSGLLRPGAAASRSEVAASLMRFVSAATQAKR